MLHNETKADNDNLEQLVNELRQIDGIESVIYVNDTHNEYAEVLPQVYSNKVNEGHKIPYNMKRINIEVEDIIRSKIGKYYSNDINIHKPRNKEDNIYLETEYQIKLHMI